MNLLRTGEHFGKIRLCLLALAGMACGGAHAAGAKASPVLIPFTGALDPKVAVDSAGNLFTAKAGSPIRKYSSAGVLLKEGSVGADIYAHKLIMSTSDGLFLGGTVMANDTAKTTVVRVNADGAGVWTYSLNENAGNNYMSSLVVDDGVYVASYEHGTSGADRGQGDHATHLRKLDSSGKVLWGKDYTRTAVPYYRVSNPQLAVRNGKLVVHEDGKFKVLDATTGAVIEDRDIGYSGILHAGLDGELYVLNAHTSTSGTLVKIDENLNVLSSFALALPSEARLKDILVDPNGMLYATGALYPQNGNLDVITAKLSAKGTLLALQTYGRRDNEQGYGIAVSSSFIFTGFGASASAGVLRYAK